MTLDHKFVEFMPEIYEDNTLYISMEYCTAIHKCMCGCGNKVITPISPIGWKISFDGKSVTLNPSIGSWNLKCKSHYFIQNSKIIWSNWWDESKIKKNGLLKQKKIDNFFKSKKQGNG